MEKILNIEDLFKAEKDSMFTIIRKDSAETYYLIGTCKRVEKFSGIYLLSSSSVEKTLYVDKYNFKNFEIYLGYDTKMVGEIMVKNLENEIENIKTIYTK